MTRKIFMTAFAIAAIFSALPAPGALPDRNALLKISCETTAKKYPDANTVLLADREEHRYEADGTGICSDEYFVKAMTEAGRRSLSSFTMHYNNYYERDAVTILEIISPDGKVTQVDIPSNTRDSSEAGQVSSNIFDPAQRVLQVRIPGLKTGDVLHVRTTEKQLRTRIPGQWSNIFSLQSDQPILQYEVLVDAPQSRPLQKILVKNEVKNSIRFAEKKTGDRIQYFWCARNVPRLFAEPKMPPMYLCAQRLLVSTAKDWQEISRWYYRLCRPRLDSDSPEMRAKVAELVSGAKNDQEKIMRLFQFVSQKIRYVGMTDEKDAPGYEPHNVADTFAKRHGVCRDKAALLVRMLELAGLKACPVLFMAGQPKDGEVPNIFFNHAIVGVETAPGQFQLMDPTEETTTEIFPSYLSNMSYLPATEKGETLHRSGVVPAPNNVLNIYTSGTVDAGGSLLATVNFGFRGVNDLIYRDSFSSLPENCRTVFFEKKIRDVLPGAELLQLKITPFNVRDMSRPLSVSLKLRVKNYVDLHADKIMPPMPYFGSVFGASSFVLRGTGLQKRQFPYRTFSTCSLEEKCTVKLPPGMEIVMLPGKVDFRKDGVVRFSAETTLKNDLLTARRSFSLDHVEFSPQDYLQIKKALRLKSRSSQEFPVFKRSGDAGKFAGADCVILSSNEKWNILDEHSAEIKLEEHIRVLNYAGIKDNSELKITYNPEWESVSLQAEVRAPGGTWRKLGKKDFRLLDSPAAADAPRVPQWKMLVAAFPGVAVNSEVRYRLERKLRSRAWFVKRFSFAEHDPVLNKSFELRAPAGLKLKISETPFGAQYQEKTDGKYVIRKWTMHDLPVIPLENAQAPHWSFVPTVAFSSGHYAAYAAATDALLRKKAAVTPEIAALAAKLAPEKLSVREKVRSIRDYCAKHVRAAGPQFTERPFGLMADAGEVLRSRYGNSAERAVLLSALLQSAGVKNSFILTGNIPAVAKTEQEWKQFASADFKVVLVHVPYLDCCLNDGSQYALLGATGHEDKLALTLPDGKISRIISSGRFSGAEKTVYHIVIARNGSAEIRMEMIYSGNKVEKIARKFAEMTPEERRRHGEALAGSLAESAVLKGELRADFSGTQGIVKGTFSVPDFAVKNKDCMQFDLPGFNRLSRMLRTTAARRTPMLRREPQNFTVEHDVRFPAEYRVELTQPEHVESGRFGSAAFYRTFTAGKGSLCSDCGLTLPVQYVNLNDYRELGELHAMTVPLRHVILKKTGGKSL